MDLYPFLLLAYVTVLPLSLYALALGRRFVRTMERIAAALEDDSRARTMAARRDAR